jgi:hypothetical protein
LIVIRRNREEKSMNVTVESPVDALVLDLLEWVASGERTYHEVMEAWRTSCPRLPVWEDATDRGLVARARVDGRPLVRITASGRALLAARKPAVPA